MAAHREYSLFVSVYHICEKNTIPADGKNL